jgi:hypothetical protein
MMPMRAQDPEPCIRFGVETRIATDAATRGGDLFDVLARADGSVAILIADVSSKDVLGIGHSRMLRAAFRNCAHREHSPAAMLSRFNRVRLDGPPPLCGGTFASALIVAVESGAMHFRYASAGHDIALVVQERSHRHLMPTGPVLGLLDDAIFADSVEPFGPRDRLLLATDGFTECRSKLDGMSQFGTTGIARTMAGASTNSCAVAAYTVAIAADAFTAGHYRDDATVAVIALKPAYRETSNVMRLAVNGDCARADKPVTASRSI